MKPQYTPILLLLFFFLLLSACGSNTAQAPSIGPLEIQQAAATPTESEPVNEYAIIDRFIALYNETAAIPLADVVPMDIHGEDYRTEFRLQAFNNAIGKKASLSGDSLQIVNYGVWSNDSIRFYGYFASYDDAVQFVYDLVHILDNSISDENITAEFSGFEYTSSVNIYLGDAGYISGYLHTSYSDGKVGGYDVFIDCTDLTAFGQ